MTKLLQVPQRNGLNSENISVASIIPTNANTRSASEPIQFSIDMFSVHRTSGDVTSGNATTICDSSNHAFFKITLTNNVKRRIINKAILKVAQSSYSADNFYVCLSDANYSISSADYADGYMRLLNEDGVNYRLIDISPFIQRESQQDIYVAVIARDSNFVTFYTGQGDDPQPTLELQLLEDDDLIPASTVSNSVGQKGSYSINTHNGKLFFTQNLFSSKGSKMPASLSIVYNVEDCDTPTPLASVSKIKGWNFNYAQSLAQDGEDMLYLDGNHMYHKFKKATNNASVWTDVSAKNGAFVVAQGSGYVLSDGQVTTMEFDSNKRLTRIQKQVGTSGTTKVYQTTTITYNTDGTLSSITDGMGDEYTFEYASNSIAINKGTQLLVTLEIASQQLTKISYASDTRTVLFGYNSNGLLSSVTDSLACQKAIFDYNTAYAVSSVKHYATSSTENNATSAHFMQYDLLQTRVHSCRNSDAESNKYSTVVYSFAEDGEEISSSLEVGKKLKPIRIRNKGDFEMLVGRVQDVPLADVTFGGSKRVTVTNTDTSDEFELDTTNSALNTYILSAQACVECCIWDENNELKVRLMEGDTEVCSMVINASKRLPQTESCVFTLPQGTHTLNVKVETGSLLVSVEFSNICITATNFGACKQFINQNTTGESITEPNGTTWYTPKFCTLNYDTNSISNVRFTAKDYALTTISRLQNPSNFNVWYNDGANMVYGVASSNLVLTTGPCGLGSLRMCTVTPSRGKQNYSFLEPSTSNLYTMRNVTYALAGGSATYTEDVNANFQTAKAVDEHGISTEYTYDANGSVTKVVTTASTGGTLNIEENYTYNYQNLLEASSHMRYYTPYSQNFEYGSDYELTKDIQPNTQEITFAYSADKLASIASTLNNQVHSNVIGYQGDLVDTLSDARTVVDFDYDERHNISQVKIASTVVLSKAITYNQDGTTQSVTTYGNGQVINKYYDKYNRLIKVSEGVGGTNVLVKYIYSDEEVATDITEPTDNRLVISGSSKLRVVIDATTNTRTVYSYDSLGQLCKVQNQNITTTQTLDNHDRVARVQQSLGSGGNMETIYQYVSATNNNLASETTNWDMPGTISTTYTRDNLQRPTETTVMVGNNGHKYTYSYVPRQEEVWVEDGFGPIIRPDSVGTNAITPPSLGGHWEVRNIGTTPYISSFKEYSMSGTTATLVRTDSIEYDANGNITKYGNVTYKYDGLNRLVRENNPDIDKTTIWHYNTSGNITSKSEYAYTTSTSPTGGTTTAFIYGTSWKDQLSVISVGTTAKQITYDQAGNPTNYKGATFTWERGRLLASYTPSGSTVQRTLKYDANGIRCEKNTRAFGQDDITVYVYNGNNLIREYRVNEPSSQKTFLYNSQGVIGFVYQGVTYTYRKNLFGDIVAIYNGSTKVAEYKYDAWGNCTVIDPTTGLENTSVDFIGNQNPFRYRGYYWDNDLQLYYLMSRYYDPQTGRFINADTLDYLEPESINGLNLYAYCSNNPVMYADPSGHFAIGIFCICLGIGALVGGVTAHFEGQNVLTGVLTGALLGAAIGVIIGVGGAALSGAVSSVLGKTVTDLTSVFFYGGEFGTWEDYAVAFAFGGLTGYLGDITGKFAGLAKVGKIIADVGARPLANQLVKMGTRGSSFDTGKYWYDVIVRTATYACSKNVWKSNMLGLKLEVYPIKSFYRATFRSLYPHIWRGLKW